MIEIKIDVKKFFRIETTRVVAYKTLYRFLLGLIFLMAWNLFVNTQKYYSIFEIGFFTAGIFYFGFAWKNYLQIDGMRMYCLEGLKNLKTKKKKAKVNKSMVDYVDEETVQIDNLDDDEEIIACLFANLFSGGIYVFVYLIYIFF